MMEKKIDRTAPPARAFAWPGGPIGVILIHGFASSLAFLSDLGRTLAAKGYSVVGVRLAGHGTDLLDLQQSTAEDWSASARSSLGLFPTNVQKIVVVGESMGALLGLRLAREWPSRIRGLVLLAPPLRQRNEMGRRILSRLLPPRMRWKKRWVNKVNRADYLKAGSLLEVTAQSYREFLRLVDEERRHLRQLGVPILAFFGDRDYATDPKSIDDLRAVLPAGQFRVKLIPGASHHLAHLTQQGEVENSIIDFIEELP
ncbi:MAG: alpha/beta fold hydrolase [Candidatus Kerfeldbacteria bacterium]|nr:alpha/beta fold hydrolase [Candidatus Kerfeldbacteria bacterium]